MPSPTITGPPLPVDESFARPAPEDALQRAASALREHRLTVHVVTTLAEARDLVLGLVPTDRTVFTATSETLRLSGIAKEIDESGRYQSVRKRLAGMDRKTQGDDMRRMGATPDIVLGSVHAVTEDGRLVVASATGSQLGPYASGAGRTIWVVGAQKVVADLATALRRIETHAYPKEDARARVAYGKPSAIAKLLIINREQSGRGTVVLVREPVGF